MREKPLQKQIRTIRRSVASIDRALSRLTRMLRTAGPAAGPVRRRRLDLSPKRRAALKLHGTYIGHVRQLKPAQKVKVKAIKAQKGYHAAIAMAKRLLHK